MSIETVCVFTGVMLKKSLERGNTHTHTHSRSASEGSLHQNSLRVDLFYISRTENMIRETWQNDPEWDACSERHWKNSQFNVRCFHILLCLWIINHSNWRRWSQYWWAESGVLKCFCSVVHESFVIFYHHNLLLGQSSVLQLFNHLSYRDTFHLTINSDLNNKTKPVSPVVFPPNISFHSQVCLKQVLTVNMAVKWFSCRLQLRCFHHTCPLRF